MANNYVLTAQRLALEATEALKSTNAVEISKLQAKAIKYYGLDKADFGIHADEDIKYGGKYSIRFRAVIGHLVVVSFTLDLYPDCCAMHQLNNFHVESRNSMLGISDELFNDIMNQILHVIYRQSVNTIHRLMINFVEHGRTGKFGPLSDIPEPEKPYGEGGLTVDYKQFWDWAQSQEKVGCQRFVNHNTGHIIVNTHVVLK